MLMLVIEIVYSGCALGAKIGVFGGQGGGQGFS